MQLRINLSGGCWLHIALYTLRFSLLPIVIYADAGLELGMHRIAFFGIWSQRDSRGDIPPEAEPDSAVLYSLWFIPALQ